MLLNAKHRIVQSFYTRPKMWVIILVALAGFLFGFTTRADAAVCPAFDVGTEATDCTVENDCYSVSSGYDFDDVIPYDDGTIAGALAAFDPNIEYDHVSFYVGSDLFPLLLTSTYTYAFSCDKLETENVAGWTFCPHTAFDNHDDCLMNWQEDVCSHNSYGAVAIFDDESNGVPSDIASLTEIGDGYWSDGDWYDAGVPFGFQFALESGRDNCSYCGDLACDVGYEDFGSCPDDCEEGEEGECENGLDSDCISYLVAFNIGQLGNFIVENAPMILSFLASIIMLMFLLRYIKKLLRHFK